MTKIKQIQIGEDTFDLGVNAENIDGYITEIPIASAGTLGGIKVGDNLEITEDGILSATGSSDSQNYIIIADHNSQATALDLNTLAKGVYVISAKKMATSSASRLYYKMTNNGVFSESYFDCSLYGTNAILTVYEQIGELPRENGTILSLSGINFSPSTISITPRVQYYKIGMGNTLDNNGGSGIETYLLNRTEEQTITGKKTYSVLPESSVVPTNDNQFANKKYVDDAITSAITTTLGGEY